MRGDTFRVFDELALEEGVVVRALAPMGPDAPATPPLDVIFGGAHQAELVSEAPLTTTSGWAATLYDYRVRVATGPERVLAAGFVAGGERCFLVARIAGDTERSDARLAAVRRFFAGAQPVWAGNRVLADLLWLPPGAPTEARS